MYMYMYCTCHVEYVITWLCLECQVTCVVYVYVYCMFLVHITLPFSHCMYISVLCSSVPSVLEYMSYCFNFHSVLAGPSVTMREHLAFMDGSNFSAADSTGNGQHTIDIHVHVYNIIALRVNSLCTCIYTCTCVGFSTCTCTRIHVGCSTCTFVG